MSSCDDFVKSLLTVRFYNGLVVNTFKDLFKVIASILTIYRSSLEGQVSGYSPNTKECCKYGRSCMYLIAQCIMDIFGYFPNRFHDKYTNGCHHKHLTIDYEKTRKECKDLADNDKLRNIITAITSIKATYYTGPKAPFYDVVTGEMILNNLIVFDLNTIFHGNTFKSPPWTGTPHTLYTRPIVQPTIPSLLPEPTKTTNKPTDSTANKQTDVNISASKPAELSCSGDVWESEKEVVPMRDNKESAMLNDDWTPMLGKQLLPEHVLTTDKKSSIMTLEEVRCLNAELEKRINELEIKRALKQQEELRKKLLTLRTLEIMDELY
jgi:hypothetical protein